MSDPDDEVIRQKILNRFPRTFAHGPPIAFNVDLGKPRGRRSSDWHPLAIAYVRVREAVGISRNQACREIQQKLAEEHVVTVEVETVTYL